MRKMIEPGSEGYEPLTPKTSGVIGGRLWIGEGHILSVEDHFFFQRYRRFYFKDIQAVWVQNTPAAALWAIFWIVCALPFLFLAFSFPGGARTISGIATAFCLAMLLVNHQRGQSCSVYIQTAVQTRKIAALKRRKRAEDVLEILRPWIQMAQEEAGAAGGSVRSAPSAGKSAARSGEESLDGGSAFS